MIDALQKYAKDRDIKNVASKSFCEWFGISQSTIQRHFGTWADFCNSANISPRYSRLVTKQDLLDNLDQVWSKLGRQPRAKEMKQPLSPISISRYQKLFNRSWYEVCLEFISWRSGISIEEIILESKPTSNKDKNNKIDHKTNRSVNLSLRYNILKRDNFQCVSCGASPAFDPGTQLHIDHIIPWSKGGETEESSNTLF